LCQQAQLTGAVIVSTPQDVATTTTLKGLRMFESLKVPILGLVENMSYFVAPDTGKEYDLFGKGKVALMAQKLGHNFLGAIPIDSQVVHFADKGQSLIKEIASSPVAQAFVQMAQNTVNALNKQQEIQKPSFLPETIYNIDPTALGIHWVDGLKQKFPMRFLRAACTCAACKNEWSGEAQITEAQVKPSIAPVKIDHVGNYALNIAWNDNHSSGIYTYDYLRKIGTAV
jgi:ATP-binding protein involved in chromosome partitioning